MISVVSARGADGLSGALAAVGAVALQLGSEPFEASLHVVGDRLGHQTPAHVLVELEAFDVDAVVGEREQPLDSLGLLRRADQDARPDDPEVRVGGREEPVPGEVEELARAIEPLRFGQVATDRVERVVGDGLHDLERALAAELVGRERDEVAGGELLVAHHVPQRVPEEQALERRLEAIDLFLHERQRAVVERDLGKRVVAVVGEDGGRRADPDEALDDGFGTVEVDRHGVAQYRAVVAGVVDRHLGPVRAEVGVLLPVRSGPW